MLQNALSRLSSDRLYVNSLYLMGATAVLAGFGFFFWLIVARLFSTADIGLATALISVMGFITFMSLMGFNVAFVRFLPESQKRDDEVNTGMLLVSAMSLVLATLFVLLVPLLSPALSFIHESFLVALLFIVCCIFASLNTLTDAFFLAMRDTKFTLIINVLFSVLKVVLPFAFVGYGALGVFSAAAGAQIFGCVISIAVMRWKFDYRPRLVMDIMFLKQEWKYCAGNYSASVFNLLPVVILPLLITNRLGAESTAYYYVAMMIVNMLYMIPYAATRSLFAEGSHDTRTLALHTRRSVVWMSALLFPSMLVLITIASPLLGIFGAAYAKSGTVFLQLAAGTGVFVAIGTTFGALFQIKKSIPAVLTTNAVYALLIIILSYVLIPYGLVGIGVALLIGSFVSNISAVMIYAHIADTSIWDTFRNIFLRDPTVLPLK